MPRTPRPIGLITAIPDELGAFGDGLDTAPVESVAGLGFRRGTVAGRPVVAVEAGIGKVNAALVAGLLADRYEVGALVFSGVAGGLDPGWAIGDVVIADRLVAHDYGALVDGALIPYQPGVPPLPGFPTDHGYRMPPALRTRLQAALDGLSLPRLSAGATGDAARRPRLGFGTVLTGDAFLNCASTRDRLFARFGAAAIEMEGAAVAQVAERFGRPWVVVRALSDLAGAESHMDFPAFLAETARVAARVVERVVPALP